MGTLYEYRLAVRRELGESVPGKWSDTLLDRCIESALKEFSRLSGCLVALDTSTTTTAGTYAYNLPATCPGPESIIGIRWGDDVQLIPTSVTALIRLGYDPDDTDTDTPSYWYIKLNETTGRQQVCLYANPDSAETLKIWYGREAASPTTDHATLDMPETYKRGVICLAVEDAFLIDRQFEYANEYHKRGMDEVGKARAFVEATVAAGLQHRDGTNSDNLGMF
jgi:hypothetical protein